MKQNDVYRIWDRENQEYAKVGIYHKTSWRRFPKEALENAKRHDKRFKEFDKYFEIHKFTLQFDNTLNSKGKSI